MTGREYFFVGFQGDLSDDDRFALDRPGFKLYQDGVGISQPFFVMEGCSADDVESFHVVRVPARNMIEARDRVVHALGHSPRDLKVWEPSDDVRR